MFKEFKKYEKDFNFLVEPPTQLKDKTEQKLREKLNLTP